MKLDVVTRQLYEAALPLACVVGGETNHCASCGWWGGVDFGARDEHAPDCELYAALLAYRAAVDPAPTPGGSDQLGATLGVSPLQQLDAIRNIEDAEQRRQRSEW